MCEREIEFHIKFIWFVDDVFELIKNTLEAVVSVLNLIIPMYFVLSNSNVIYFEIFQIQFCFFINENKKYKISR